MDEPRWLVDEMLGRLVRYLRFLGYDAEYVRGVTDDQLLHRGQEERRRIITRDRNLSGRAPGSILLTRTDIGGQIRELSVAFPELRQDVRFDRCTICNGRLDPAKGFRSMVPDPAREPLEVRTGAVPLFSCTQCGHIYWEGSHTRAVRERLARWRTAGGDPE